jgi:CO/xanthine dehydrogenase Mo-binding subunit
MKLTRRELLVAGGGVCGGLVLGFVFAGEQQPAYPHSMPGALEPNAFVQVTPDGRIILQIHKTEMGQGILTGLTTLVAEELNVSPWRIETPFSGIHPDYLNPQFNLQITNASSSLITCYLPLRQAAAAVRVLLLQAAAQTWGVGSEAVHLEDGFIIERGGDRKASIGEFATLAATLPVPEQVELKAREDFRYIGTFEQRLDSAGKVDGSTVFGIDTALPDALTAVVVRCPHFGGALKSFDADEARALPGVVDIFAIERGVAVVASGYWHARRAANRVQVEWLVDESTQQSSATIDREQTRLLDARAAEDGDFGGEDVLSAEYTAPFQPHVCMEPMNATAAVKADQVDVWLSTQAPCIVQAGVAHALGRPLEQVTVHTTFAGGGFGRRVYPFVSNEAALIAAKVGRPVKVIWSREDDIRHDLYRPAVKCRMSADMNAGDVRRWRYRVCGSSLQATLLRGIRSRLFPADLPDAEFEKIVAAASSEDTENIEGAVNTPYRLGEMDVAQLMWETGIPVSFWRSVGHSFNGFFVEGFIDEMAHRAGADVIEFRRAHLEPGSRARAVLDKLVEVSNWGNTAPGVYQGVAIDEIKGAVCGQVADVEVQGEEIRVRRVVCVVDPVIVINPDIARTQIESNIVWGLTAALKSEVTIENRAVKQSNFNNFPLLRINETPLMEVHFIESGDHPAGVGECAAAPVAPAVANAVFRATGKRLRSLPLRL